MNTYILAIQAFFKPSTVDVVVSDCAIMLEDGHYLDFDYYQ